MKKDINKLEEYISSVISINTPGLDLKEHIVFGGGGSLLSGLRIIVCGNRYCLLFTDMYRINNELFCSSDFDVLCEILLYVLPIVAKDYCMKDYVTSSTFSTQYEKKIIELASVYGEEVTCRFKKIYRE